MISLGLLLFAVSPSNFIALGKPILVLAQADSIDLEGRLEPTEIRRGGSDVIATIQFSTINAVFKADFGTVQIMIQDESGNILHSSFVESALGTVNISTVNVPEGVYKISFGNGFGTMWGYVAINNNQ